MKKEFIHIATIVVSLFCYFVASAAETLVFFRHGEKPLMEIGQINCQGLNRSLKLPNVLLSRYGAPDYLFAPNPSGKMLGYFYTRPLVTLQPTAIKLNMPVDLSYNFYDIKKIGSELLKPQYRNSTVFIAWEHVTLVEIVRYIYSIGLGRNPLDIPFWNSSNYDSFYVLRIDQDWRGNRKVTFTEEYQGLNNLDQECPY